MLSAQRRPRPAWGRDSRADAAPLVRLRPSFDTGERCLPLPFVVKGSIACLGLSAEATDPISSENTRNVIKTRSHA